MNPVAQTASKEFAPSTQRAQQAAVEFVTAAKAWGETFKAAQDALRDYVRKNVGEARGFVSRDQLNMSVFGVMFDKAPAAGFIAVPNAVADGLREQGLRGNAYFPDVNHPVGIKVRELMNDISRVAEKRPLLNTVPGVKSVSIEGSRVVMSRAVMTANGDVVVKAAPSALAPDAQVQPVKAAAAKAAVKVAEEVSVSPRTPRP